LALGIGFGTYAQKAKIKNDFKNHFKKTSKLQKVTGFEEILGLNTVNNYVASELSQKEMTEIGATFYDTQTNSCNPNRVLIHADGTMSAVWTMAAQTSYADRGTGYNYFNGTSWGANPIARVESKKTGWGQILVSNGKEIVISHNGTGLTMASRTKGTGAWTTTDMPGSADLALTWPRAMSFGENGMNIIGIASNGEDADTTLYLFKSNDGGATFTYFVPEGMDTTIWAAGKGLGLDTYAMDIKGNTIAIAVGGLYENIWLFKSTDGGNTFTRKQIFIHPMGRWARADTDKSDWNGDGVMDTLTGVDGAFSVVLDNNGIAHVVGNFMKYTKSGAGDADWGVFYATTGVWYWNEFQKPIFVTPNDGTVAGGSVGSANFNHFVDSSFCIATLPDLDGNGEYNYLDLTGEIGDPWSWRPASAQIHLAIADDNTMALTYAGVNELSEETTNNVPFRNIFMIVNSKGKWINTTINITDDLFTEQVFPQGSNRITKEGYYYYYHLLYQIDDFPGGGVVVPGDTWAPIHGVRDNFIQYNKFDITTLLPSVVDGVKNVNDKNKINSVSNYPNPFNGATTIAVSLNNKANVSVVVTDLMGKNVIEIPARTYGAGVHKINIDGTNLSSGIYIYNVKADNFTVSNKMIVE